MGAEAESFVQGQDAVIMQIVGDTSAQSSAAAEGRNDGRQPRKGGRARWDSCGARTLTGQSVGASAARRRSYRQNPPDINTQAHMNLSIFRIRGTPRLWSPSGQLRNDDCQVGCHAPTSVAVTLWRSLHAELHPERQL